MSDLAVGLAAIVVLGVVTQWVALKLRVPMVLLLLAAGVLAGPVLSLVEPQELFGDTLYPAVAIGVGLLLFEGGLGLRFGRLETGRTAVLRLVTVGGLVTWAVAATASALLLDVTHGQAVLLGAVLIVSGPTVVLPLLAQLRVRDPADAVARWEGIVIDPIGAMLAVVVLEVLVGDAASPWAAAGRIGLTVAVGVAAGALAAWLLTEALVRHVVPDNLVDGATLMFVVVAVTGSNLAVSEAGLFAAVVMGIAMANQRRVPLRLIQHFEESLGLLILGALFVVLGASLDLDALRTYLVPSLGLLAVLILVARPLAVVASTVKTPLSSRDRIFLMSMVPRGIVAAAVSALFALELARDGTPMDALVPVVYVVIFGTVIFSSVVTRPLSKRLRLAKPDPTGIAIVGGGSLSRGLAHELHANDVPVLVIPDDEAEASALVDEGLLAYHGQLDTEHLEAALDGVGVRQAIVLSGSEQQSSYAVPRLVEILGRANVYYLPAHHEVSDPAPREAAVLGRKPVAPDLTREQLVERFERTGEVTTFDPSALTRSSGGEPACAIVALTSKGATIVDAQDAPPTTAERFVGLPPG